MVKELGIILLIHIIITMEKLELKFVVHHHNMFPKKQYAVETRDALGNDLDVSLLGFPEESDWILFAPYNDKSLMRDVLVYKIAASMGRYASRSKFCEVVLNDEYIGVYVLLEKVKRDANRVNIKKLEPPDISGDALTGGYIIKIDKTDGENNDGWYSTYLPLSAITIFCFLSISLSQNLMRLFSSKKIIFKIKFSNLKL